MATALFYIIPISYLLVVPPVLYLWKRDRQNANEYYCKPNNVTLTSYATNKWLLILCQLQFFVTIIVCTAISLSSFFDFVCVTYKYYGWLLFSRAAILTFYQITRFYSHTIHSKYGKCKKLMFVILYIIGIIIIIFAALVFEQTKWIYHPYKLQCSHILTAFSSILSKISYIFYLSWDWTVLYLLYCKVRQFRSILHDKSDDLPNLQTKNKMVLQRLLSIFSKIFLLTIISEILFLCNSVNTYLSQQNERVNMVNSDYFFIFSQSLRIIDLLLSPFVIYLMNEHNNNDFIIFINIIYKMKCHCCCKALVEYYRDYHQNATQYTQKQIETSIYETRTLQNQCDLKIIPQYQSELTISCQT